MKYGNGEATSLHDSLSSNNGTSPVVYIIDGQSLGLQEFFRITGAHPVGVGPWPPQTVAFPIASNCVKKFLA